MTQTHVVAHMIGSENWRCFKISVYMSDTHTLPGPKKAHSWEPDIFDYAGLPQDTTGRTTAIHLLA